MDRPVMLLVAPHLSTGGLPQYLLWQARKALDTHDVHVAEWEDVTGGKFVVQRKAFQALLGPGFHALAKDGAALLRLVEDLRPAVIHFAEVPEVDIPADILAQVYVPDAPYEIRVSSHSTDQKFFDAVRFLPHRFVLVSPLQVERFARLGVPCELQEYDPPRHERPDREAALRKLGLDPKLKHVLNVGLFTPGKNQGELMEIARKFDAEPVQFHFVGNLAPNFADYWRPLLGSRPRNCRLWQERDDVDDFYAAMDLLVFTSKYECNPLVVKEAVAWGMPVLLYDLPSYVGMAFDPLVGYLDASRDRNCGTVRALLQLPPPDPEAYKLIPLVAAPDRADISFLQGARVIMTGLSNELYDIKFIDAGTRVTPYATPLTTGQWASTTVHRYVPWEIQVVQVSTGKVVQQETLDMRGKRVLISFESKALGDTIAWFPYVEEFRKRHGCEMVAATFWNELFRYTYPQIRFVEPGKAVPGVYASYRVGWFWGSDGTPDPNYHWAVGDDQRPEKNDFRRQRLQRTASDILGLPFAEIKPKLSFNPAHADMRSGLVGIGVQSTMQLKYWNNPKGWQEVVDWLKAQGKTVLSMSREVNGYMGNHYPYGVERLKGYQLERVVATMSRLEAFVGTNSGLAWIAWALGVPTVVIEGATSEETLPGDVLKVTPEDSVCRDCFARYRFDPGKWDWCPDHGDDRHKFECTRSVTGEQAIRGIQRKLRDARTARIAVHADFAAKGDREVIEEVYWGDSYELAALKRAGLDPKSVVDVGGHIGTFGLKVRELWPEAGVWAYEPSSENCRLYRLNVPEATVVQKAVLYEDRPVLAANDASGSVGSAVLFQSEDEIGMIASPHLKQTGTWHVLERAVERVTLEGLLDACGLERVDLLKLDCEGGEYSILEGMEAGTPGRIGCIVGEYHATFGNGLEDFRKLMGRRFPGWVLRVITTPTAPLPNPALGSFIAGPEALVRATCTA